MNQFAGFTIATGILVLSAVAANADDRDEAFDLAMGALNQTPNLERPLTMAPQPWPGPRYEPPFKQQPEAAQRDFRAPAAGQAVPRAASKPSK